MITREYYLAAPWVERESAREFRDAVDALKGWICTARWLDSHHDIGSPVADLRGDMFDDLADIHRADTFIMLNNYPPSAGRLTEFGYALAKGKRLVVIQPPVATQSPINIFLLHPTVEVYDSLLEVPNERV